MVFYIKFLFVLNVDILSQRTFRTQISEVRLLYLLGELARRTDREETAIHYFSKVIESRKKTVETKLIEMAQDQWKKIKEERKNRVL